MENNIAQELVILRAEKSWTQKQLAEKLGTTQRTVAAWESGESVPRKTTQVNISKAFGLPRDHFLTVDNHKKEASDNRPMNEYAK